MPEFSIVIPVYNGQEHLGECLDSLLGQTFADIEIVCIDDCGTDRSADILAEYARNDSRVRVLRQPQNLGSARGRRRGVLESTGTYVLFSDQDDSLAPQACQVLHNQLSENPVDILHYGTTVIGEGDFSETELRDVQNWFQPSDALLIGRQVLDGCFVDRLYDHSIWNKAYKGSMAREAFAAMEDVPIPLGEDNYETFVLAFFAESFRGLPGQDFYRYHFGRGFTGHNSKSAREFKRTIGLSVADNLIKRFLESRNAFPEYEADYIAARDHMMEYIIDRWAIEIADVEKEAALREVLTQWDFHLVFAIMRRRQPRMVPLLLKCRLSRKVEHDE